MCIPSRVSFGGLPSQLPLELGHDESPQPLGIELVTGFFFCGLQSAVGYGLKKKKWDVGGIKLKSSYHPRLERQ